MNDSIESFLKKTETISRIFDERNVANKLMDSAIKIQEYTNMFANDTEIFKTTINQKNILERLSSVLECDNIKKLSEDSFQRTTKMLDYFSSTIYPTHKEWENLWLNNDFQRVLEITQSEFLKYDNICSFEMGDFVEKVTDEYIVTQSEHEKLNNAGKNIDKYQLAKEIGEWIVIILALLGFYFDYVKPREVDENNTTIEVNNYYVNDLQINAELLNAMSYKIINCDNVIIRAKPNCSSTIIGRLHLGQVVIVSDSNKKWVKINWENKKGEQCAGWIQNWKLSSFK